MSLLRPGVIKQYKPNLFICEQHYSKSYKQTAMKIYGGVRVGKGNKLILNFGGDPDHHVDFSIRKPSITQKERFGLR